MRFSISSVVQDKNILKDHFDNDEIISRGNLLKEYQETDTEKDRENVSKKYEQIENQLLDIFPAEKFEKIFKSFEQNEKDSFGGIHQNIVVDAFIDEGDHIVSLFDNQTKIEFIKYAEKDEDALYLGFAPHDYKGTKDNLINMVQKAVDYLETAPVSVLTYSLT